VVNDPDVPPNLCFPGKAEVAEEVAELTGKKAAAVENLMATVRCSRPEGKNQKKEEYVGYVSCAAASLAFGGPMACRFACVGLGDCVGACQFDAISLVNGFPVVDPDLCVACGACVRTCPKEIIELIPAAARVWVPCATRDPGKTVKELCGIGCITCRMCVKVCPAKAVTLENGRVHIDHKACMAYGPECGEVCVEKCPTHIFRKFVPRTATGNRDQAVAA
jgi:electron transport complex protein RnfB